MTVYLIWVWLGGCILLRLLVRLRILLGILILLLRYRIRLRCSIRIDLRIAWLGVVLVPRRGAHLLPYYPRRCWRLPVWWCDHWPASSHLRLVSLELLLGFQEGGSSFDESILNWTCNVRREDWSSIQSSGNRFFPGLQHLIHFPPSIRIHQCIGFHECCVELPSKEERIWGPDIFDN